METFALIVNSVGACVLVSSVLAGLVLLPANFIFNKHASLLFIVRMGGTSQWSPTRYNVGRK